MGLTIFKGKMYSNMELIHNFYIHLMSRTVSPYLCMMFGCYASLGAAKKKKYKIEGDGDL